MVEERSEESERSAEADGERLTPITRTREARRRRRVGHLWWLLIRLGALAVALALGAKLVVSAADGVDCVGAPPGTNNAVLIAVCAQEFEETGDPEVGLEYARALYRNKNYSLAADLATSFLVTPIRSDALHLLGRCAWKLDRKREAMAALEQAHDLHRAEKNWSGAASDQQALATFLTEENDLAGALRMLDGCIADARAGQDRRMEGYCYLQAGQTLSTIGRLKGAREAIDLAELLLVTDRDLADLHAEKGNRAQDDGHNAQAVAAFESALPLAVRAQRIPQVVSIHLNLAYSKAEIGHVDDAARHLDLARTMDDKKTHLAVRLHLEARIAYHRRNLPLAASLLEEAYRATMKNDEDERIQIASLRSRVALALRDLQTAEQWARFGVQAAERLRERQSALEVRAWILSNRREPYELLFVALARAGRAEEALLVFNQRYGRTLFEAVSRRPEVEGPLDLKAAAVEIDELSPILSSLSAAPLIAPDDDKTVLEAVRSADLLALVVAEGEVWRLTSMRDGIAIRPLGSFAALESRVDEFTRPQGLKDTALAERLGTSILPDELVRETEEALHVVLDGPLMSLPVAALRRDGRPLIAFRPVIRSARLGAVGCAPPAPPTTGALVLADAEGDLPRAKEEAGRIALVFGTTALLGLAATSQALFTAQPVDLLHIATHAQVDDGGAVLRLADRKVHAFDIWKHNVTARRVVLAACESAVGGDDEGATSLATAFLARGSSQVVATLRAVTDPGAEQVISRFYHEGGANDPVRALAAAQRALATTKNRDWPNFAVFGRDTCRTTP